MTSIMCLLTFALALAFDFFAKKTRIFVKCKKICM